MFSLHFSGFQNDSFCSRKRPVLLVRMNHSARQNGPFCGVKWAILKNGKKNLPVLSDSFIKTSASVFVEWKKRIPVFSVWNVYNHAAPSGCFANMGLTKRWGLATPATFLSRSVTGRHSTNHSRSIQFTPCCWWQRWYQFRWWWFKRWAYKLGWHKEENGLGNWQLKTYWNIKCNCEFCIGFWELF